MESKISDHCFAIGKYLMAAGKGFIFIPVCWFSSVTLLVSAADLLAEILLMKQ